MIGLKYSNVVFIHLLIASIIPFLILGPFFPDLIVSVSALFFIYYVIKNKNFYYFYNKPFIIFIIFCFTSIVSSLFSEEIFHSFESSLFYFRIGVFSCFIWYLIDRDKNIVDYFYYALIFSFIVLVIDGYFQYFTGENIFGLKIVSNRISSFFGDELVMGSYLSRLFPLLFALFLAKLKKNRLEIYVIGALFVFVDVLIYLSGERTAFFFLNLSTIFIIILIKKYQKFRLFTFIMALIFILVLSLNSSALTNRMIITPAKNMGLVKSSSKPVIFSRVHDGHIRTAYLMFKDKLITGHGPKSFRIKCSDPKYSYNEDSCSNHPHNFYVQLLAENGVIGFLFLLSAFIYILYEAFRQFKSIVLKQKRTLTDYQVCLLAGLLISIWPFSPNGNFYNNWLMIIYSLPVGFYLQSIYSKRFKKDL
jgi:O-antigen ligase